MIKLLKSTISVYELELESILYQVEFTASTDLHQNWELEKDFKHNVAILRQLESILHEFHNKSSRRNKASKFERKYQHTKSNQKVTYFNIKNENDFS